jgi:DNA-directed RNA polymerase specialized sigma24 family protein
MIHGALKRLPEIMAHVTAPSHFLYEGSSGEYKAYRRPGQHSLWDLLADISVAWGLLDNHGKRILYLYYLEGCTDETIAHELGVERSTVNYARHRATGQLTRYLMTGEKPDRPTMRKGKIRKVKLVRTLLEFYD